MEIKEWKNDVNVLFLFFSRPKQTAAVFEQIKLARPRRLFLYQDGPRPKRQDDKENIRIPYFERSYTTLAAFTPSTILTDVATLFKY